MAGNSLDRLLASDYLDDLPARPIEEIRSMRAEGQAVEVGLSYLRRLVQGRLDIVAAEARHRREGGDPTELHDLVEQLPEILSDHVHAPGVGRLPSLMAPSEEDEIALQAELDAVCDSKMVTSLADVDDAELDRLVHELTELERSVSARRKALFERIDALQAELTRRYRTGEASVESLLR
jgi:hypothetical protein